MNKKDKIFLMLFFFLLLIPTINSIGKIIYTTPQLTDRTPFSNKYLIGEEGTSKIYKSELHFPPINIKDKNGVYQPFNQVVNISLDQKQDPIIEWNDKSFSFEGYGIKKGEKKADKTTELKKGESYYEFITKSNDMKTKEEDDLYVYNFTKTSTDCHKLNDWELVCGESEDYIKVSFKKLEEQNYTILLDEESAILTGGDLSSIDPTISIYVNDSGGMDTYISYTITDHNFGTRPALDVKNATLYTLIFFNTSILNIPQSASISSSNFSVWVQSREPLLQWELNSSITPHRITSSWVEGVCSVAGGCDNSPTVNGTTWQVRWFNQTWITDGGDYDISNQSEYILSGVPAIGSNHTFDIKEYTQGVVNGSYVDNGILLKAEPYGSLVWIRYESGETTTEGYEPILVVTYTVVGDSPTYILNTPSDNKYTNESSILFGFDVVGIQGNVTLFGNWSDGVWKANETNSSGGSGVVNYYMTKYIEEGVWAWGVHGCNTNNNCSNSANRTLILDRTSPVVSLGYPANNTYETTTNSIYFYFNVTDLHPIANCSLFIGGVINGSIDTSIAKNINQTFQRYLQNGDYLWSIMCHDQPNNLHLTGQWNLSINNDLIFPDIWLDYPQNISYNIINLSLNVSSTATDISQWWFSLDRGTTNTTFTPNTTFLGAEGSNILNIYVNDTSDNINSTNVSFFIDATPPIYSDNKTSPNSTATYSESGKYEFNITWTDNGVGVDSAIFNFNGTNYTMNANGNVYNYTLSGLSVATYTYLLWANDSLGNQNQTVGLNYIISKATPSLTLSISPSNSVEYGNQTTVNGTGCPSQLVCNLSRNGTNVATPDIQTLGVSTYNYTYNTSGNANYSSKEISSLLTITRANSLVYTYINNSRANLTIINNTSILLNGSRQTGEGNITLYKNQTQINSGNYTLSNLTDFNGTGRYNITSIYEQTQNYSFSYETWYVNVTMEVAAGGGGGGGGGGSSKKEEEKGNVTGEIPIILPEEEGIPLWLIILIITLLVLGGAYYTNQNYFNHLIKKMERKV